MARSRGFGAVSSRERRDADAFFDDLMGHPSPRRAMPMRSRREAFETAAEVTPMPLSHYEQWIANSVATRAATRDAPLGPAWVRARLLGTNKPGELGVAATELRELDRQRRSRTTTDLRVDTAQVQLLNRAEATLLPIVEATDTSVAGGASCPRTFATTPDLATRKTYWRGRIDTLARTHRTVLLDWLIGKQTFSGNPIVRAATSEASQQIDCLRRAATAASGRTMASPGTRAPTRNFDDQLCIWLWKYFFRATRSGLSPACSSTSATYTFGSMTNGAVATCTAAMRSSASHFTAGSEWDPVGRGAKATAHRTGWTTHLSSDQREREILQTSSAPGISRHHWGTDIDFGSTSPADWRGTTHANLYRWLQTHALAFGLVQVYTPDRPGYTASSPLDGYGGYIEERWHWSYYPVAQALVDWARVSANKAALLAHLQAAWGNVATSSTYSAARSTLGWATGTNPFHFIEAHWEDYVFNVNRYVTPPVV